MKLSTRIITAVLLVAGSSGVVYAFSKHNHWGMSEAEKIEFVTDRATRKLELNDEQQRLFATLASNLSRLMQEARSSRRQDLEEIETLLQAPTLDQARAIEMVREKTALIDAQAPEVIASLALFLDSLSIEQRQRIQDFVEHVHQHHESGHRGQRGNGRWHAN